ncbi:MAG: peroxiredoxin family protein [Colwellia sp.]
MKKALLLSTLLLLASYITFANPSIELGLELGQQVPEISVLNTQQQAVNIKQLSGEKGLIIVFFRSADWCSFCKKHLIELNDYTEQFTQLGYGLAAISYDSTTILQSFTDQQNISYPLLSDQKVQTMLAYNIVNADYAQGDEHYGIPYPGVVVIDKSGKLIHKYFYIGYKNRVKFEALYLQLNTSVK